MAGVRRQGARGDVRQGHVAAGYGTLPLGRACCYRAGCVVVRQSAFLGMEAAVACRVGKYLSTLIQGL